MDSIFDTILSFKIMDHSFTTYAAIQTSTSYCVWKKRFQHKCNAQHPVDVPSCLMCHLRQRLRIYLFRKKIMFRFQDNQVFVF